MSILSLQRNAAVRLDRFRARILARTLPIPLFAWLFRNRPARLAAFFLASLSLNLVLALTIPLWIITLGAIAQGAPHLVSSILFVPRLTLAEPWDGARGRALAPGALLLAVATLRIWAETGQPGLPGGAPNAVELAAAVLAVFWLARFSGAGAERRAVGLTALAALAAVSWIAPAETLGALVLAHHFVGFVYWIRRAPTAGDRLAAMAALALFASATAAILAGVFDPIIAWRSPGLPGGALDDVMIGLTILPNASDPVWFGRAASALALGQSLHYLVWLKAIPEQELPRQHPIGFAKSLGLLERDAGPLVLGVAFCALAGLMVCALAAGLAEARALYLAAAAFHGYFEIAGLAFLRRAGASDAPGAEVPAPYLRRMAAQ